MENSSPYFQNGSDGKDIGANMNLIKSALEQKRDCGSVSTTILGTDLNTEILLYPNPAKDHWSCNSKEVFNYYVIYDIQGNKLLQGNIGEVSKDWT